jgi:aldehyde dehydrogenase (NAD+)
VRSFPTDKAETFNYTRYEPLGVVAAIVPWNSPLMLLSWKLAPALAAGNTVVIKPSEYTSASALEFMRLVEAAGFPPGVVNVVTGFGPDVGSPLVEHPLVAKIAFTGSDATGQRVYEAAARGLKRVSLELGGKSPNIVFDDAHVENAIKGRHLGHLRRDGPDLHRRIASARSAQHSSGIPRAPRCVREDGADGQPDEHGHADRSGHQPAAVRQDPALHGHRQIGRRGRGARW